MRRKSVKIFSLAMVVITAVCFASAITYREFPLKYSDVITRYCDKYNVDKYLVFGLIKTESNFTEYAVSRAGATGLMQLTDETFEFCRKNMGNEISKPDIFNPSHNIAAGIWYLSYLTDYYGGNIQNALAAYNAGAGNVDSWLCGTYSDSSKNLLKIPYKETRHHINKTKCYMRIYKLLYPKY